MDLWNFTSFQVKKHRCTPSNPVYHQHFYLVVHSFVFSKEGILLRTAWVCLASYLKPPLLDGLYHIVITRFYTNSSIWIQLEKGQDDIKLRRSLKSSKNGWLTNNGWGGGGVVNNWGVLTPLQIMLLSSYKFIWFKWYLHLNWGHIVHLQLLNLY